jgi:hypothetical protein
MILLVEVLSRKITCQKNNFFDDSNLIKLEKGTFQEDYQISFNVITLHFYLELTEVAEHYFSNYSSLKEIHLPNSITVLGKSCFCNFYKLTRINLHDSIKKLPENCFNFCDSLKNSFA